MHLKKSRNNKSTFLIMRWRLTFNTNKRNLMCHATNFKRWYAVTYNPSVQNRSVTKHLNIKMGLFGCVNNFTFSFLLEIPRSKMSKAPIEAEQNGQATLYEHCVIQINEGQSINEKEITLLTNGHFMRYWSYLGGFVCLSVIFFSLLLTMYRVCLCDVDFFYIFDFDFD